MKEAIPLEANVCASLVTYIQMGNSKPTADHKVSLDLEKFNRLKDRK